MSDRTAPLHSARKLTNRLQRVLERHDVHLRDNSTLVKHVVAGQVADWEPKPANPEGDGDAA